MELRLFGVPPDHPIADTFELRVYLYHFAPPICRLGSNEYDPENPIPFPYYFPSTTSRAVSSGTSDPARPFSNEKHPSTIEARPTSGLHSIPSANLGDRGVDEEAQKPVCRDACPVLWS